MSYSFLAGLEYAAKLDAAPIDPDTLIVKDFGSVSAMGGNSIDENGRARMREYSYKVGEVRTGPDRRTDIGVEAEAPPEGYRWVLSNGYPVLWKDGEPLPKGWPHYSEIVWPKIDGVRVR